MPTSVMWFRRDLRLADNPALADALAAAGPGGNVVALFCLDDRLLDAAGAARVAFLVRCLRALDERLGGCLVVRRGDPVAVVADVAREAAAVSVHAAADFGPYGAARDRAVAGALRDQGVPFALSGSSYAVDPGLVTRKDGGSYSVFGPFSRAWSEVGWDAPLLAPEGVDWNAALANDGLPDESLCAADLPPAGEDEALAAATRFRTEHLEGYADQRDRPDLDATSRLSPYLKFGCIHPRQLLDGLGTSPGAQRFRTELCWREFYADVLFRRPQSARTSLIPAMQAMEFDQGALADERFERWAAGETGFPIVDAGMRQLAGEAWMHNRVRMIVASFLVKDLHIDWRRGARLFMQRLVDGDLASNQHGWQWTAGTGTDPAPFFRVFNPAAQGRRFDPDGAYVRRWVPELGGIAGGVAHEPDKAPGGRPASYAPAIVDHATERAEALARWNAIRNQ